MKRLSAVFFLLSAAAACHAANVTYTATVGQNTATVTFSMLNSTTLQVTLGNTSVAGAASANDILTAVFFAAPGVALDPYSATTAFGGIRNCSTCTNWTTNVAGEWAYGSSVYGLIGQEAVHVLTASDISGATLSRIGSTNLANGSAIGGIDFGIASSNTSFGQSALTGSPLVSSQVVFRFDTSSSSTTSAIGTIGFLFGDNRYYLNPGNYNDVPEPGTYAMIGLGLIGAGMFRRRRNNGSRP